MTLHLVIEYNWLYEFGAHKFFFCPICHCCYIPRMWIRIRVYVWRWLSACKCRYTYMCILVLTYIYLHMAIVIFLLHIMYYLWKICAMQLLFNFGNKLIFIAIVIVIEPMLTYCGFDPLEYTGNRIRKCCLRNGGHLLRLWTGKVN